MEPSQIIKFSMGAFLPLELECIVRMITSVFKTEEVCNQFRLKCFKNQSQTLRGFLPFY